MGGRVEHSRCLKSRQAGEGDDRVGTMIGPPLNRENRSADRGGQMPVKEGKEKWRKKNRPE